MPVLRKKTKLEQTVEMRRKRRETEVSPSRNYLERSSLVAFFLFIGLAALLVLICFVGQSPAGPPLIPGQPAKARVTAELSFSYISEVATQKLRDQRVRQLQPEYRRSDEPFNRFSEKMQKFQTALNDELAPVLANRPRDQWERPITDFLRQVEREIGLRPAVEDVAVLMEKTDEARRRALFQEALLELRSILRDGVYSPEQPEFQLLGENDYLPFRMVPISQAERLLNISLAGIAEGDKQLGRALFRLFRRGLQPNVERDEEATRAKQAQIREEVPPVRINIAEGEPIVTPGETVTPIITERYEAYREALAANEDEAFGVNRTLIHQATTTVGLLASAVIWLQIGVFRHTRSNRRLMVAAILLVANLGMLRLFQEFGDSALMDVSPAWVAVMPYAAPVAFAALVATIITGASSAVLLALLVSIFFALMQGSAIDVFVYTFLGNLFGIFFCRDIRLRARVVRAGALSGLPVALAAAMTGLVNDLDTATVFQQVVAAGLAGVGTGILAIGILPLIENSFKYTTDITLLELTDTNHPLLRKLQLAAPGSYHHSLMVANLAERAANQIGANPLFCRATCLFHDIGKMVKPEYFVENQAAGFNPHDDRNPTMSALIIKNHVKEGVALAREYNLPQAFIDIIKQHHGTTLIKFFYHKALSQAQAKQSRDKGQTPAPSAEVYGVDESSFRYDGPRPRTVESSIIFFADAVEAASRSLKKVTPQTVEELVDNIFNDRIEDGQLDESPITLREIRIVRDSFCFTLLNMLHSRLEYPKKQAAGARGVTRAPQGEGTAAEPAKKAAAETSPGAAKPSSDHGAIGSL